jgi:hypothetical protein
MIQLLTKIDFRTPMVAIIPSLTSSRRWHAKSELLCRLLKLDVKMYLLVVTTLNDMS